VVVDWPADPDDQAALKHTVLAANCPVLLYTGTSSESYIRAHSLRSDDLEDASASASGLSAGGALEQERRGTGCLSGLKRAGARLGKAVQEEFGGVSLACCLGLRREAGTPAEGGGDVDRGPRSLARQRIETLRRRADDVGPLDSDPLEAAGSAEEAGDGKGMVTVMIAGRAAEGVGRKDAMNESRADSLDVAHIFHVLGAPSAAPGGSPLPRTRSSRQGVHLSARSRSGRVFAPILISPHAGDAAPALHAGEHAAGAHEPSPCALATADLA
jgi:hypothetical protein